MTTTTTFKFIGIGAEEVTFEGKKIGRNGWAVKFGKYLTIYGTKEEIIRQIETQGFINNNN